MTLRKSGPPNLGVLMIDFNPVVREGLLAILTKDDNIEVIGDVPDEHQAIVHIKRSCDRGRPVEALVVYPQTHPIRLS